MATPSAQFSLTLRVELPHESGRLGKVTAAIADVGAAIVAVDAVEAHPEGTLREITIDCERQGHRGQVLKAVEAVPDAQLIETTDRTSSFTAAARSTPTWPRRSRRATSCRWRTRQASLGSALRSPRNPRRRSSTRSRQTPWPSSPMGPRSSASATSAPAAAMPVMEGQAMLFKEFADVDAFQDHIIPSVFNREVSREVARAVAEEAERARPVREATTDTAELTTPS